MNMNDQTNVRSFFTNKDIIIVLHVKELFQYIYKSPKIFIILYLIII